jgi:hypothetical protein
MIAPVAKYRVQADPLHSATLASGAVLTGLLFAILAPDATYSMVAVMCVFVMAAVAPATLVLGCDGFALTRFGRTHYVSFAEVLRLERTLRGVRVVRREGGRILLLNYGISVSARDYIAILESRFDEWGCYPEPTRALPGMPFRAGGADPAAEALNPRLSAGERLEALGRLGGVEGLARIVEEGAAFADPNIATCIERLKARNPT